MSADVQRLVLDVLAVDVSACLERAGIPHALLKGPSTALWLYDPPRGYVDVDVLIPLSRIYEARTALESAGVAYARAGEVGEDGHTLLMVSPAGSGVDVHLSLPTMPLAGDRVWEVLAPHIESLDLGIGTIPALDEPARCLTLALHALEHAGGARPREDLRRALVVTDGDCWHEALELALALKVEDLFHAGLSLADGNSSRAALSRRANLYLTRAPSEAVALQRFRDARRRDVPRLLWREIFPTRGFMRYAYPGADNPRAVARAYVARWRRIGANLPSAIRALRRASTLPGPAAEDEGRTKT